MSLSPEENSLNGNRNNLKVYSTSMSFAESESCQFQSRHLDRRSRPHPHRRHHLSPSPETRRWSHYISGIEESEPVNKCYHTAVDRSSYRYIHDIPRYEDDVASEMWRRRTKRVPRWENRLLEGRTDIVYQLCNQDQAACDSSKKHEGAAARLYTYFMTSPALTVIRNGWYGPSTKLIKMMVIWKPTPAMLVFFWVVSLLTQLLRRPMNKHEISSMSP